MFGTACTLRRAGWTDDDAIHHEIEARSARKNTREISEAVRNSATAIAVAQGFRGPASRRDGLPHAPVNQEAITALTRRYGGLAALRACSPSDPTAYDSQSLIDALFPPEALLCLALDTAASAQTWPRERWRGIEETHALLVPSPMTATLGVNQQGQHSSRCLDNTGPRRFLVIEADHGDLDRQAAALLHLARREGPLVMVVHSGGKSLHGWFYCEGQPEHRLRRFFKKALSLGADRATWTRCQLVRMPGAIRPDTGRRQEVLFLNPAACPGFPPEGLCSACWRAGRSIPLNSPTPCPHRERRAV